MDQSIDQEFGIDFTQKISVEDFVGLIEERVILYLDQEPELLMSYLYRIDVLEKDIQQVLKGLTNEIPSKGLARLIYQRQFPKAETRRRYTQPFEFDWDVEPLKKSDNQ